VKSLLSVRGVTHRYRDATILRDVYLEADAGEFVALAGRSGSGKSTLCHLIAGIEAPDVGQILVDGSLAGSVDDWAVAALLPQRLALAEELSVAENALLPCWLRGMQPPEDLLASLALAGIADAPAGQTSLGEQQRTGLARVLCLRPRLALLDEPTGHQDDDNVERVLEALRTAQRDGTTVVVATHDDRVLEAASRVVRLAGGAVVDAAHG
jgi:ABC-type lipoprotein export system ATPase subunit